MADIRHAALLRDAERQIRIETGVDVRLIHRETLPSPHVLLRCQVIGASDLPESIILKQVTTAEFTSGAAGGTSHRLLNEWAALLFLGSLPDSGPWPDLLAANRDGNFVVLGDLGSHPTVEEILMSGSPARAGDALRHLGESLGRFHAAAHGRTSRFISIRGELEGSAPRSDSTHDLRGARHTFEESFAALGMQPATAFWAELADLESSIHGPGPFVTLIHADSGPQNFVWTGQNSLLIDFEFATVGDAFLDLVSARLGFPQSSEAHRVPAQLVATLESAYRQELGDTIPEVRDDLGFREAIVDACAHWALVRWAGLGRRLFVETPEGDVDTIRSQAFTVYRRFVETAEEMGHREPIAATMDTVTKAIGRRLPGLAEMPVYPALAG